MTDGQLNSLLMRIDASPELVWKRNLRASRALEARGRHREAYLIVHRRPVSCDYLTCGHVHVRLCGEEFEIEKFYACWGAGGDGESLDGSLSIGTAGQGHQHGEGTS